MYQPTARDVTRIICYLLILFAILLSGLLVFLSQLDLNDYRTSLEARLNSALDQPVRIGHSDLTFSEGLALSFKDVQIGPDKKPLAKIPQVTATLKIIPLFNGKIVLDQIHIKKPEVQLWLPFPKNKKESSSFLLPRLGINSLDIDGGHLKIYQQEKKGKLPQLTISKLNAALEGWKLGHVGLLKISGKLENYGTSFIFETRVPRYKGDSRWRQESFDTRLTIANLPTSALLSSNGQKIPQHVTLNLAISGTPATGATVEANLRGASLKNNLSRITGRWLSTHEQESITAINGTLLQIPLTGDLSLLRKDNKHYLAGKFKAQNIEINPALLKTWNITETDQPISGILKSLHFELKNSWGKNDSFLTNFLLKGGLAAQDLKWQKEGALHLQKLSCNFSLKNKTLSLNDGLLIANEQPLTFSGNISDIFNRPQLKMGVSLSPQIELFTPQFSLPETWVLSGTTPLQLQLSGILSSPSFYLNANFNQVHVTFGSLFKKKPGDRASLELTGSLKRHTVQLDTAALNLGETKIVASGALQSTGAGRTYQLAIKSIDLKMLQLYSPLLTNLQTVGTLSAELSQQQMGLQGTLTLDGVGAHLTSLIGDLNNTNGQIDLDRHGLTFQGLRTSLGQSEFVLTGILSNWSSPHFSLDLTSKKVRAHDLIFSNRHLTLYDLKGHLNIDKKGLDFAPVNVRLEEDTLATVTGNVSFSDPKVHLDIQAEKANILNVIDLFTGPHTPPPPGEEPHRVPTIITAEAKSGTLGGLHFQNAKGLITSDEKRLTIFPLKFKSDEGWCQARVLFDYDDSAPLKISGHAEKINATLLHQHLFESEGLVSGQLNGDFYLEGNPRNGQFWQTAQGGIHAQITAGVLRKFHGLAKVFSLLNVSQLFAGKLPDMDKEGMPFSLAEGSILLDSGRATTKDLQVKSDAMNLSIVGSSDLVKDNLNLDLAVMPLGTVDKIITAIPVAGWILTGKNKSFITAHFKIEGSNKNPEVRAVPIDSVSDTVVGIFRRTFGLPGKLVKNIGATFEKNPQKKGGK